MPAHNARDLTDFQWAILNDLIPEPPRRDDERGRPWRSRRSVLSGILWVLRTGAPWADLPNVIPLTRRAIADSSNGCGQESCEVSSKL
jgi:transposase